MEMEPCIAIWQMSGGPTSRSYAGVLLKNGVGLIGPGDTGAWHPDRDDSDFEGGFIRRWASEIKIGDAILLRSGISKIRAVGIVASEYLYLNAFDDVNGWDLQHARRIRWSELPAEYDFGDMVFGANPARFSRVGSPDVIDYTLRYLNSAPTFWQCAALPPLPEEEPSLEEAPEPVREIIAHVQDLFLLLDDSHAFGEPPTEDEMVGHFVLPLLRCLGWPPERIAVKWNYIDIALFKTLPRKPLNCCLVIEAKRIGGGVEGALEQAKGYVRNLGLACDVVVTDGIRYRLYSCEDDFAPVAYANLARLKRSALTLFTRLKRN